MAWVIIDLDNTLVHMDPMSGEVIPTEGSAEAMAQLAMEGHRLTVYTSRFAPMPSERKEAMRKEIESLLTSNGFPPMEVWTGTTKPAGDVFIGQNHITYDGDWGLVLAQSQVMMEESGLVPGPQPDDGMMEPDMEEPSEF